jgi:hypothetical protein
VPLEKPAPGTSLLGEPTLTMTYSGTAASSNGRVYARVHTVRIDTSTRQGLGRRTVRRCTSSRPRSRDLRRRR